MTRARRSRDVLSDLASHVYAQIYGMTARQRRAALRALDKLTSTNCSASLFDMRHVLREYIYWASSSRAAIRKRKRGAA